MSGSPISLMPTHSKLRAKAAAGLGVIIIVFALFMSTNGRAQQQADAVRIGQLALGNRSWSPFQAFERRLSELGYVDDQNIQIEFPDMDGNAELLPKFAAELALTVDIFVTSGPEAVLKAARAATATIPIVAMAVNYNPVAKGYVDNLARTGTNVTGVYFMQVTLSAKRLALLKETMPDLKTVAALWDVHTADQFHATQEAATDLEITLLSVKLSDPPYDFEPAIANASKQGAQALVMLTSPLFNSQREKLVAAATAYRLPTIYIFPHYVELGGLMAYGPNLDAMFADAATYVNKIIKGARPTDLPMEQPTVFELVINLKAAEALGLKLPPSILLQATELIE